MTLSVRAWLMVACSVCAAIAIATPLWWYIDLQNGPRFTGPMELKHMLEIRLDPSVPALALRHARALAADPAAQSVTDLLLSLDSAALRRIDDRTANAIVSLGRTLRDLLPNARLLLQFAPPDTTDNPWPNASACRRVLLRADIDGVIIDLRAHGYPSALAGTALQILNDMRYDRRIDGLRLAGMTGVGLASRIYGALAEGESVHRSFDLLRREAPSYVILDAGASLLPQWFVDKQQMEQSALIHSRAPACCVFLARQAAGDKDDGRYAADMLRILLGRTAERHRCDLGLCSVPPRDAPASPNHGTAFQSGIDSIRCFTGLRENGGALLLMGGGRLAAGGMMDTLVRRMGGPDAAIVVIPTAMPGENFDEHWPNLSALHARGVHNITVLHTRDAATADSAAFCEPLRQARAVLILGGRQWRLIEAFQHTRLIDELHGVLRRGGIVAGTSAGASALASFLVRGQPGDNSVVIGKYSEGFGLLENVAIDQHLLARRREFDLVGVVRSYPELLGIGIDEHTGILVESRHFTVLGDSRVAVYDSRNWCRWPRRYLLLQPGQTFDMDRRCILPDRTPLSAPSEPPVHDVHSAAKITDRSRESLARSASDGAPIAPGNTISSNPSL